LSASQTRAFKGPPIRDGPSLSSKAILAERLTAQGLSGSPQREPLAVAERLLAIQAQDPRGARLAIRARTSGLTAADVDLALSEQRSLLVTWLNRGTLHLTSTEDYPWLLMLTAPAQRKANARRLAQEGITADAAERGVGVIERSLANDGPLIRSQLRDRLDSAGVSTVGQALVHLLALASLRGVIVRGPMVGKHQAFVLTRDWLGPLQRAEPGAALAELARRYLRGHGPAGERDLAKWAGLALRDVRAGLRAIASELGERDDGLLELAAHPPTAEIPPPRLLGAFDPVLLGWTSREAILGPHTPLITTNGLFRPFAMVRGRAIAIWKFSNEEVTIEPFDRIPPSVAAALDADAGAVARFLGATANCGSD